MHHWKAYVPVARRRATALRKLSKLKAKGHAVAPVEVKGRQIAHTFWGKAWCDNLERYSDFKNRLPRGRTYVRNGSVIDLQVAPGKIEALVSGSEIYKVTIAVPRVAARRWVSICDDCGSSIKSVIELLQGRMSDGVMERICQPGTGLFPEPSQIDFRCTCPDWAWMCKHVAAVLYGVGARLDKRPELLFSLRDVDINELVSSVDARIGLGDVTPSRRMLKQDDLSELFGLDLAASPKGPATKAPEPGAPQKRRNQQRGKNKRKKPEKGKRAPNATRTKTADPAPTASRRTTTGRTAATPRPRRR